jgi:hypothetical protein
MLGRHRPTGEQISSKWYYHSNPWDKPHRPLGRLTPAPPTKKLNNKQGTEKEHAAEGMGFSECTEEGGKVRS